MLTLVDLVSACLIDDDAIFVRKTSLAGTERPLCGNRNSFGCDRCGRRPFLTLKTKKVSAIGTKGREREREGGREGGRERTIQNQREITMCSPISQKTRTVRYAG